MLAFTQYLDDSGCHDGSPLAVIGGPVIDRADFFRFEYEWDRILRAHGIEPPIHMKEFARPHGRLAYVSDRAREPLFADLIDLIEGAKRYSASVGVMNLDFKEFFPAERFRGLFGPTPLAFLWCLIMNSVFLKDKGIESPIAYLVAQSDSDSQMVDCHLAWQKVETKHGGPLGNTGAIAFDVPKNVGALQAADMIAWSNRRQAIAGKFDCGFEPLERLTTAPDVQQKTLHWHYEVTAERTKALAEAFASGEPLKKIGRLDLTKWVELGHREDG